MSRHHLCYLTMTPTYLYIEWDRLSDIKGMWLFLVPENVAYTHLTTIGISVLNMVSNSSLVYNILNTFYSTLKS